MIRKIYLVAIFLSLGACGGATGTSSGLTSLEGAPIDIPLPIAKGVSSVDPTSLAFAGTDTETVDNIGEVSGTAVDETTTQELVVIYDGEVKQQFSVTGNFTITLPQEIESKPVAVSVCVSGCDVIAEPVYFKVGPVNPLLGRRTFAVFLTNSSASMTDTTRAFSIQPNGLVEGADGIYLSATNADGNPVITSINSNGLFSESPIELDSLLYDLTSVPGQNFISGFDEDENEIVLVDGDGNVAIIDTGTVLPSNRSMAISPDSSLLATSVFEDPFNPVNQNLLIVDLETEDQFEADLGASANVESVKIDWLNNTVLFVVAQLSNGNTEAFQVDISDPNSVISNTMAAFLGLSTNDLADNAKMIYVASHGEYFYQCIPSGSSFVGLCSIEGQAPFEDHVLITGEYDVVDFTIDDEETHIIAEVDLGDSSAEDNVLGFIPIPSDDSYDVNYLSLGTNNVFSPDDAGFYSLYPVSDTYQVAFTSVANYLLPRAENVEYEGFELDRQAEASYDAWEGLDVDVAVDANFSVSFENLPDNVTEICIECSADDNNLDFDTPHEMGCGTPDGNTIVLSNDVFSDANTFSANCLASDTVLFRGKITAGGNTAYSSTFYITTTVANP
ncbi:hypothetical protein K1X76_06250 [bacterium]|nr:hypothetical protein [bacterium]